MSFPFISTGSLRREKEDETELYLGEKKPWEINETSFLHEFKWNKGQIATSVCNTVSIQ